MSEVQYYLGKTYPWGLKIPKSMVSRLEIIALVELSEMEGDIFFLSLRLLANKLERDGFVSPEDHAIVVFAGSDEIPVRLVSPAIQASYAPMIFYHMNRIRRADYLPHELLVIFLEELVHCFLHLRNESAVKETVSSLVQACFPGLSREVLYAPFQDPGRNLDQGES